MCMNVCMLPLLFGRCGGEGEEEMLTVVVSSEATTYIEM